MTTKELAEKNPFFTWEQFRQEAGVETTGYARLQAAVKSKYVERLSKGIYVSHVGPGWRSRLPSFSFRLIYLMTLCLDFTPRWMFCHAILNSSM